MYYFSKMNLIMVAMCSVTFAQKIFLGMIDFTSNKYYNFNNIFFLS